MKFSDYVTKRMEPFGAMKPPFGCMYDDMFAGLRDCLMELAQTGKDAQASSELAWAQTTAGSRIKAVCNEGAEGEETPTLPVIRAIWKRLFPPDAELVKRREECQHCGGTGYVLVERNGHEGVQKCGHEVAE